MDDLSVNLEEILRLMGFRNTSLIGNFDRYSSFEDTILKFMRKKLPKTAEKRSWTQEKKESIFGDYYDDPESFEFLPGEMLELQNFYRACRAKFLEDKELKRTSNQDSQDKASDSSKKRRLHDEEEVDELKSIKTSLYLLLIRHCSSLDGGEKLNFKTISVKSMVKKGNTFEADIICVCGKRYTVYKRGKESWTTSNFYTHIRREINKITSKSESVSNTDRKITSFFKTAEPAFEENSTVNQNSTVDILENEESITETTSAINNNTENDVSTLIEATTSGVNNKTGKNVSTLPESTTDSTTASVNSQNMNKAPAQFFEGGEKNVTENANQTEASINENSEDEYHGYDDQVEANNSIKSKWRDTRSRAYRSKIQIEKAAECNGQFTLSTFLTTKKLDVTEDLTKNSPQQERAVIQLNINDCVTENPKSKLIQKVMESVRENEKSRCLSVLELICESSLRNVKVNKHRHAFTEDIKLFAVYVFLTAGRKSYEFLQSNLNSALPSSSSVRNYLSETKHIEEGVVDFDGLLEYLTKHNYPKIVVIAEDQTRVWQRVKYDKQTHCLIGFLSPTSKNGLPVPKYFKVNSSKCIQTYFEMYEKATFVNLICAQPLHPNAAPFCLAVYGTRNNFTHIDVKNRWSHIEAGCEVRGIINLCNSGDGDSKLVKVMRIYSGLGSKTLLEARPWFLGFQLFRNSIPVQDPTHTATKGRNRLLRRNKPLVLGHFSAKVEYLEELIKQIPVSEHSLSLNDLNPVEKMKFSHVLKMTSPRVIKCLKSLGHDKLGIITYIELVNDINQAYLDRNIGVEDRIKMIWQSAIFCRIWKNHILKSKSLTLSKNFITSNLHLCIEINAHALINIIGVLRNNKMESCFLPWLFGSQSCESIFRAARSMTPTQSTVIHFSVDDFTTRLKKIQIVNQIPSLLKSAEFPRQAAKEVCHPTKLPNEMKINSIVQEAILVAKQKSSSLGMSWEESFIYDPKIEQIVLESDEEDEGDSYGDDYESDYSDEIDLDITEIQRLYPAFLGNKLCFSECAPNESSVKVKNSKTNEMFDVKISTLCWFFDRDQNKAPSTDRLRRFIDTNKSVPIEIDKYYAVKYERWYIGRAIKKLINGSIELKFLKESLGTFSWPKKDDIAACEREQVFYGPVQLQGLLPFTLLQPERDKINKAFKKIK